MTLPAELPRVDIIIEPQGDLTGCVLIGEVVTEVLEGLVWFDYQQGRSQRGPKALLDNVSLRSATYCPIQ